VTAKFLSYHRLEWRDFLSLNSPRTEATALREFINQDCEHNANSGRRNIEAKGATYYGTGAALVRIIRAILCDGRAIVTVSSRVAESMQLGEVSQSLPNIIDRHGIARVLPVALNPSERRALEVSAEVVRRNIASLSQTIPI
jgi:L-lactate dehydrogenase